LRRNKFGLQMSAQGQSLPKFDVRVRSAFHPIATKSRTFRHFGFGPISLKKSAVAEVDIR
jgi:hypothetical protein